jgi:hypothetical protein
MIKVKNHICSKCGLPIEVPDYDETRPISEYFPKWERTILKHGWQYHREDFPPQFKSFTRFMKWVRSPEGKEWNQKQGLIADAERIVRNSLSEGGSKE